MSKRRIIESVKTLLIIVLTASALLLIRSSSSFSVLVDRLQLDSTAEQSQGSLTGSGTVSGSTVPNAMVVFLGDGSKHTVVYDGEAMEECYRKFSAIFGEALGSAGQVREITKAQWEEALSGQGFFLSYRTVQRPDTLASWLGTAVSGELIDAAADMFIVAGGEGGNAALCYAESSQGKYYRCETAVGTHTLANAAGEFQPNGGRLAYETAGLESVFPYTVIPGETPAIRQIKTSNPMADSLEISDIYRAFDFNSGALHQYEETDGTKVLVESNKTMRISPNGTVTYNGSTSGRSISGMDALSRAYAVVSTVMAPICGEGELAVSSVESLGIGYLIAFDYSVNGIAVELSGEEHAAEFVVGASGIESARLNLRSFSYTGEQEYLLPVSQMCALAASESATNIEIIYRERGADVHAAWVMDKAA